ncbi:MAG: TIGR04282 family arsenosugar biosynthesis glycosyltransferase [Saprospiraceae bacterium]|nr:TIGR04282 family arsenosugar biosynthesis glycosyltransferase [Saprospiraceae bacterium]
MSSARAALIVFVKNTGFEAVKSRIALEKGHIVAEMVYAELLEAVKESCRYSAADILVFYSHHIDQNDIWNGIAKERFLQSTGDLGEKMNAAFDVALAQYDKVAIVGSDCPYLTPTILEEAFALLDATDVVLGPARDGGYYLLAMKKLYPEIFRDITWSSDEVFGQTLHKIMGLGRSVATLEKLEDIDYYEAYERWKKGK